MSSYKHVLVGLDLSPEESQAIIDKTITLCKTLGAEVSLAHVIEPLTFAYAGDIPIDLSETQMAMEKNARGRLDTFAQNMDLKPTQTNVIIGQTATELRQLAQDIGADLIVVGSHGRHGLALIFGSTATDVLHGAKCDVLAIRV